MPPSLRLLLGGLDVLLLFAFAGGYLARYVHPRHAWWLQPMGDVLPLVSVLVLLATAALAVLVAVGAGVSPRWAWAAVHGAALLLIAVRFAPLLTARTGGGVAGAPDEEVLTVLTYNANIAYPSDSTRTYLLRLFEAHAAEVGGLQETSFYFETESGHLGVSRGLLALMTEGGYKTERPDPPLNAELSLPVLSRRAIERIVQHRSPAQPSDSLPMAAVANLEWLGHEIAYYNVHLRSFTSPLVHAAQSWLHPGRWPSRLRQLRRDFLARAEEAEYIRAQLDQETRPFLVAGDFNSTPHTWVYRHLSRGLADAFLEAGGLWGGTFHARLPLFRIDHVLLSPGWTVVDATVLFEPHGDHRPVLVKLTLPPPP